MLLLDEPLSAIGALLRRQLKTEIRRIQRELGVTTVFVTHDQDEAMVLSDTIFLMNIGRVEQSGAPAELYTRPRTGFAARFIGHYNILDAAAFIAVTGAAADAAETAIRPELIVVSDTEPQNGGYRARGKVAATELHGNIVRYTVQCGETALKAD